jgi:hypothetical protein
VGKLKTPLPLLPACRYYCSTLPLAGREPSTSSISFPSPGASSHSVVTHGPCAVAYWSCLLASASTIAHPRDTCRERERERESLLRSTDGRYIVVVTPTAMHDDMSRVASVQRALYRVRESAPQSSHAPLVGYLLDEG